MKTSRKKYLDTDAETFRKQTSDPNGRKTLLSCLSWVLYYQIEYGEMPFSIENLDHYPTE